MPDSTSSRIACVSYAPFRQPGETPYDLKAFVSPARIDIDLRALSQRFDCVRTYSQAHGLDAVPSIAQRYHMKVLMGIWLSRDRIVNAREMNMGIATAQAYPQVIRGVIVGNEVLLRGELSPASLADYIHQVRVAIPASVPVTYADVWEKWERYSELAKAVDYVTIHILPYWENDPVSPEHAVQHVADVYERMQKIFPDKKLMIGETGWPSAGRLRQSAEPSIVNEARYLREFLRFADSHALPYNVIEAFDQPWKRAQEGTVGGYWGIFDVNAKPKFPMLGPVVEEPRWMGGWVAGGVGMVFFALFGCWRKTWSGRSGLIALLLSGLGVGTGLAWQARQMLFAATQPWEWIVSTAMIALALATSVVLARAIAALLAGTSRVGAMPSWLRFGWLFVLVLYGILLVFDGRYRDFPIGLFALPCIGYALLGLLEHEVSLPSLEQRFMACAAPLLGIALMVEELGMNKVAWLWLGLNLAMALPVLMAWRAARRLQPQQA
jgi:exo-beta-1,3-glucanase (GH17 family)